MPGVTSFGARLTNRIRQLYALRAGENLSLASDGSICHCQVVHRDGGALATAHSDTCVLIKLLQTELAWLDRTGDNPARPNRYQTLLLTLDPRVPRPDDAQLTTLLLRAYLNTTTYEPQTRRSLQVRAILRREYFPSG